MSSTDTEQLFCLNEFQYLFHDSLFTPKGAAKVLEVSVQTIRRWLSDGNDSQPAKCNREKVLNFMVDLQHPKNKRMVKHPSYGYAHQYQIDRLKEIGIGPERDIIMKAIEKQNKSKGKVK